MTKKVLCVECSKDKEIDSMRTDITELKTDIKWIRKAIEGNGQKGIIAKVDANTTWRYLVTGGLLVIGSLVGWIITIVK